MKRRLAIATAAALLTCWVPAGVFARADQKQDEPVFLMGMWPKAEACPADKSPAVDLAELLGNPENYQGRCVTVTGYAYQRALFLDPDDMALKHAPMNRLSSDRRMGISAPDAIMTTLSRRYSQDFVALRGKVWQCADFQIWMGGYCHYTGGPFIGVVAVEGAREPMRYRQEWE